MTRWHLKHKRFGAKPWAVQAEAMKRAAGRKRFGQFLQQGLGKTALDINEFIDVEDADLNIVLAPNSFVGDWPLAPEEWGVGFLKTGMWGHDPLPFDWDCGLYAIGHETLRGSKRARDELLRLFQTRRCMLTFDESSGIKNPESGLARYCLGALSKEAKYVRLLNGTPMVQNVMDYYPQLRMLGELQGHNPVNFKNRFSVQGGYMGKQTIGINPDHEAELGGILDGCSFRALKKDWRKDMPPQVQQYVHTEMTDRQRAHYQTMMEEFYVMIDGQDDAIIADMVMVQMDKLRQISSCMVMDRVDKQRVVHWIEPPENNPKLKAALDIHSNGIGKSIIVHFYVASGEMLIGACRKEGLNPAWIQGGMKPAEIVEQKRKFNDDPSCRTLIGQQDQTSRGHTLLGQPGKDRCNKIIYYENSFSLLQRSQMNDRNHRGEQDETCNIYDPITSPMDQIAVDILEGKQELADRMDDIVKAIRETKRV